MTMKTKMAFYATCINCGYPHAAFDDDGTIDCPACMSTDDSLVDWQAEDAALREAWGEDDKFDTKGVNHTMTPEEELRIYKLAYMKAKNRMMAFVVDVYEKTKDKEKAKFMNDTMKIPLEAFELELLLNDLEVPE